jgi:hypothetical protein
MTVTQESIVPEKVNGSFRMELHVKAYCIHVQTYSNSTENELANSENILLASIPRLKI